MVLTTGPIAGEPTRPRLLDLFCGAGGASMGYDRAGFEVVGVDIARQPRYPFEFHQADALTFPLDGFDVIHASPPCQAHSSMTKRWGRSTEHPVLIPAVRGRLDDFGVPYVIENVIGAPLHDPVMLCGSMFGLASQDYGLRRHRIFESTVSLWPPASCHHGGRALPVYGHAGGRSRRDGLTFPGTDAWREGMGIDWMIGSELSQAVPPAYTTWIGEQIMRVLRPAADGLRDALMPPGAGKEPGDD